VKRTPARTPNRGRWLATVLVISALVLVASGPTAALSLTKRLLDSEAGFEEAIEDEARAQHICFTTKDMAEGIASFLERREPKFTGQ